MTVKRVISKFSLILSRHQKIRIIVLVLLMVTGGLLETLSISLIMPFMGAVMAPEDAMQQWYVKCVCSALNLSSPRTFLVVLAFVLAIIYIVKNVYLLWEYNVQYRFVYGNMFAMQSRILQTYLYKPYEYFFNTTSSEIFRVVNADTYNAFLLLHTLLNLFTELIVSVMLIITIFIIAPAITVCIAIVLLLLLLFINYFIKPVLRKSGIEMQSNASNMHKWLMQSAQGIKELKVMRVETYFVSNFEKYGCQYAKAIRRSQIISMMPKYIIEAASMSTMFVVIALIIYGGGELGAMVPVLSAIAMAAIRLLPSMNRVSSSLGAIALNEPMLDTLISTLDDIEKKDEESQIKEAYKEKPVDAKITSFNKGIEFNSVDYAYPGTKRKILDEASLFIKKGEAVGIVGESGAGKSTAADVMLGLLRPQSGVVCIDGININDDMDGWYSRIGYIPQTIFMLDDTIRENISFGNKSVSEDDIRNAIDEASLSAFIDSLPEGIDTQIGERGVRLSGGQRQRIGIARALCRNPDVLIFDEATSALDNETESAIMESINRFQGQKTLIIIAHRLSTIENCDHVYRVRDGRFFLER